MLGGKRVIERKRYIQSGRPLFLRWMGCYCCHSGRLSFPGMDRSWLTRQRNTFRKNSKNKTVVAALVGNRLDGIIGIFRHCLVFFKGSLGCAQMGMRLNWKGSPSQSRWPFPPSFLDRSVCTSKLPLLRSIPFLLFLPISTLVQ